MRENKSIKNNKIIIVMLILIVMIGILLYKNLYQNDEQEIGTNNEQENLNTIVEGKVDIIDVNSKSRPYALVVNNTDVAVKVQEGLNKAYLVYEIPTEGNTSRLIALYKDIKEDLVVGTIRSSRHNFVDFALESNAILCCFGWSHYAERDMKSGSIDYLQGLYGYPYYRSNPEKLATEHTAYTSISKLDQSVNKKGFKTTSDNTILLNYNVSDVDLSVAQNRKVANTITIPYGKAPQIASFKYNPETKMYTRYENSKKCIDYNTKEEITTKNIITYKVDYKMCDDNYYWDLNTISSGEGYYITNGYAVPINWSKTSRSAKTKYTYKEGTILNGIDVSGQEISVSDGRTYIEIQTTKQKLTIE